MLMLFFSAGAGAWAQVPDIEVTDSLGAPLENGSTLTLPDSRLDNSITRSVLLSAKGGVAVNFESVQIETEYGASGPEFMLFGGGSGWLYPGQPAERISFRYMPQAVGVRTGVLKFTTNDPDETSYAITLTGTCVMPKIEVEEVPGVALVNNSTSDFGTCTAGTTGTTKTFKIRNTGTSLMNLSAMDLITDGPSTEPNSQNFKLTPAPPTPQTPRLVQPGGSATIQVQFAPTGQASNVSGMLVIGHNAEFVGGLFVINLTGKSVPSEISFLEPVFTAVHGDAEAVITLVRTNPEGPATVKVTTDEVDASVIPPMALAEQDTDFTGLTGLTVSFAAGEAHKTLVVPLLVPAAREKLNRHLKLSLSEPGPAGSSILGTHQTALLRILGQDSAKPTLQILAPAAGAVNGLLPFWVNGTVGDANGIDRVEVRLNGAAPALADLAPGTDLPDARKMVFNLAMTPKEGANEIVATAYDLRGNSTSVTRKFTFKHSQNLELWVTGSDLLQPQPLGVVTAAVAPASAGSTTGTAILKQGIIVVGATVKLTVKPVANYLVQEWLGLPAGAQMSAARDVVSFTMPAEDLELKAVMTQSPFAPRPGLTNRVHVLLDDDADDGPDASYKACLTGTLTPTGSFSGKLLIQGQSVPVVAALLLNGPTVFTVAGKKLAAQPVPGGTLTLNGTGVQGHPFIAVIHRPVGSGLPPVEGLARWAGYSTTWKVPGSLMNSTTKGAYTMAFDVPVAPVPELKAPKGHGYATVSLTHLGAVTMAGVLADGTTVTASTELLERLNEQSPDEAPVYVPLPTPGATTKLGLLLGLLRFGVETPESDMSADLRWFRPMTASPKVLLYPQGWPQGLDLDAKGCFFYSALTLQAALEAGATPTTQGVPCALTITDGKLPGPLSLTSFSIVKNTVVKIKPVDAGYTLTVTPTTGQFSGSFTPTWANPAAVKPAFKGVILQKRAVRGGYGFFLNNAKGETAPEGGKVLLGVPVVEE